MESGPLHHTQALAEERPDDVIAAGSRSAWADHSDVLRDPPGC
jgi:hypothetical protein